MSASRIRDLHTGATCGFRCDGYTSEPTAVRIYREDHGDDWPWCIDGVDADGHFTEAIWRFATHPEAIEALPEFIDQHMEWGGTE